MSELVLFSLRRALAMVVILYVVTTVVFILAHASPANPFDALLDQHAGDRQAQAGLRHAFGLDRPLLEQYTSYMWGLVHGQFGLSEGPDTFQQPVWIILKHRVPVTLKLAGLAVALALLVGLPIGLLSALHQNSTVDHGSQTVMMVLYALPPFVLAPIAQLVFGAELHWLPVTGWGAPGWLGIKQMILPVGIYGLGLAGYFSKSFRSVLLEILGQDYIRTARAKGLREPLVIYRHACKSALTPMVSIVGPTLGHLILGAFVIELYFSIPGVGLVTVQAITDGDYPVIEATTITLAGFVVIINALTDIVAALVDPRVGL